jgi:hypothetical protein
MANNLITLAEFKAYKGINSTNQDDTINSLLPKVSAFIKTFCKRTFIDFVDDSKVETVTASSKSILLTEFPVLEVISIEESQDYGRTYTEIAEFDTYVVDKNAGCVVPTYSEFNTLPNGYVVTYKAGYPDGLPEDLKLAVLDLVDYYMKNDAAVHSPKAPVTNSVQIEYIRTTNLPAHIKRVLDQYASHYG